ncbi:hypothetical protein GLOIN_2v1781647 [Rhizophagus irregularis DAOM 181602=DAOM 197198]|uniref:Uncharacterized protein n=1 Tax=Rhizophagus irregularis (strain DAOM 181602 / DAOM 197198 / MUCL 43194) TaxID=747089 RepID=A0A2P4PJG9_RHIID|nr:hypothetical protein GLOIN_2v1781647 [Rhizophagus irregularis DAOM 181602=DAOM 197198]POG65497.1 hypothetical protein GLOIN_2v1781647 [Rhizophagus irregularis DAOM 181602=DAOM 197198]|eukprot:XP_025172363.1 hypothetical protein GLOIN_2v1781647 [Rhizophagus irregularis DAOM 181602=DAOM 197198]
MGTQNELSYNDNLDHLSSNLTTNFSSGLVKMSASNKVLDKEYLRISNNFDVMELELMAIFIELRIDVVYKDNLEYSIYSFVEIGNDMADALSKMSLENNDNSEIFISINDETGNRNCSLIPCYNVNEKVKQKFVKDTLDRWVGYHLKTGNNIKEICTMLDLSDLWNYHNLVVFRSSREEYSILD